MKNRTKVIAAAALVVAAGTGTGIAVATGDSDTPIPPGTDRERASEVAVKHVGEGRVTETEIGDEKSYYEVEVTRNDGSQVDVQLDRNFNVVGAEADGPGEEAEGSADD